MGPVDVRSYIDGVRVRGDAITVCSHLTFLAGLKADPSAAADLR